MTINEPITFTRLAITKKAWGEERLIHNADGYCGKILVFHRGAAFSDHWHHLKTETWAVLSGHLRLDYYDLTVGKRLTRELVNGDVIHVPAGNPHKLTALEDTEVAEVSTIHRDFDSYRISPSQPA